MQIAKESEGGAYDMRREELRMMLSGRIYKRDIIEILQWRDKNAEIADALAGCIFDADERVSANAMWVCTWGEIGSLEPVRDKLVRLAITTGNSSIRRLSLTLLERMAWGRDDVRGDLLDFCLERMMLSTEPSGVRALCIKIAYLQSRNYPELLEELEMTLDMLKDMRMSPAVESARKNILKRMG